MKPAISWGLGLAILALIIVPPVIRYRMLYDHHKRLREVTAGRYYRSGQLTADGLMDAIQQHNIRTVINVQDEYPDPTMRTSYWDRTPVSEKALCEQLGVRYVHLSPDLQSDRHDPEARPEVIQPFLKLLDDPNVYPVLLHCKAGLHRTGVLTAVYRMEFDGWSHAAAFDELKANGFGDTKCTSANDYVRQYLLNYRPRRLERVAAEQ